MSEQAHEQQVESRSSVRLTLNAKGDVQIDVKAVVGDPPEALDDARRRAVAVFADLRREYPR